MVMLTFKPHYPNVIWNMSCPRDNNFLLSSSVESLEVVIVLAAQTSLWNMLEQVRGKNWQGPPISTQPDRHPVVSSEYNPLISRWPQFPLMRAWKPLSNGVGTCAGHEIRRELLFLVRFSLWHGSVCMCKSSFTVVNVKQKKKKRWILFAISDISGVCCGVPFLAGLSVVHKCSWHARRTT